MHEIHHLKPKAVLLNIEMKIYHVDKYINKIQTYSNLNNSPVWIQELTFMFPPAITITLNKRNVCLFRSFNKFYFSAYTNNYVNTFTINDICSTLLRWTFSFINDIVLFTAHRNYLQLSFICFILWIYFWNNLHRTNFYYKRWT